MYEKIPFLQAKTIKSQRNFFKKRRVTIYLIQVQPLCNEVNHNHQACPFHLPLHRKVGPTLVEKHVFFELFLSINIVEKVSFSTQIVGILTSFNYIN
jgi:hypothetical protein